MKTLLTRTHFPTLGGKTAINVKNLPKIFWVTLDVAVHGAAYGSPMNTHLG